MNQETHRINESFINEERAAAYYLQTVPGMKIRDIRALKNHFGSFVTALSASEKDYPDLISADLIKELKDRLKTGSPFEAYADLLRSDIHYCMEDDPAYPLPLMNIASPPFSLFYKGSLPDPDIPCVAVIGARNCSGYGRQMAREFSRELGLAGIQLISGLAAGVDSIAGSSSITVGGRSFAVLGSGIDICYPSSSKALYDSTPANGGLISEYLPTTPAVGHHFPARNRIISGLADAVLVVEARKKSGTLITVNMALEQGKDVYAIPGRINESLSYGCNMLIRDGAVPALSPFEFVNELLHKIKKCPASFKSSLKDGDINRNNNCDDMFLSSDERIVMSALDCNPRSISEIFLDLPEDSGISLPGLMTLLTNMVMHHKIKCLDSSNYYLE